MSTGSRPLGSRWRAALSILLTAVLVVGGSAAPGEAWTRDHHGGHRSHDTHRVAGDHSRGTHRVGGSQSHDTHHVGGNHFVERRHPGSIHHRHLGSIHRRYPGGVHHVDHDRHDWHRRVIIHHRYRPIGHRLWWAPRWEAAFVIGGLSYYYFQGAFYRPWGGAYISVAAPIGACISVLPPACSVVYVGGTRYYYGSGAYYLWDNARAGYVVVPPPARGEGAPAEKGVPTVFIYPKAGQSPQLQEQDRQECEEWATAQTGFDPRKEVGDAARQADYRRAMTACLEGREYTVK
jgi:hypothetical protein